jgi:hypothetical protein
MGIESRFSPEGEQKRQKEQEPNNHQEHPANNVNTQEELDEINTDLQVLKEGYDNFYEDIIFYDTLSRAANNLRKEGASPTWCKNTAKTNSKDKPDTKQPHDDIEEYLHRAIVARTHFTQYIRRSNPDLSNREVHHEAEVALLGDRVTDKRYLIDLLVKLDQADEELRKINSGWKPWHERD